MRRPISSLRPQSSKADPTRWLTTFLTAEWPIAKVKEALYHIRQVFSIPVWGPQTLVQISRGLDTAFFDGLLRCEVEVFRALDPAFSAQRKSRTSGWIEYIGSGVRIFRSHARVFNRGGEKVQGALDHIGQVLCTPIWGQDMLIQVSRGLDTAFFDCFPGIEFGSSGRMCTRRYCWAQI